MRLKDSSCAFLRVPLRLTVALSLALLLVVAPAWARDSGDKAALKFSAGSIKHQIEYLASDELRGRFSGDAGNEKAARFIAQIFAKNGLKPLGTSRQRDPKAALDGSGYFQPFNFTYGRLVGKGNLLEATFGGKRQKYLANHDFRPDGVSGGGQADAELLFVGYGIQAKTENHDDYAGLDVKDKVVLLLTGYPGSDPKSPLAPFADIYRKATTARDLGAKAVLIVVPKNSDLQPRSPFEFANASSAEIPVLRVAYPMAEAWLQAAGKSLETLVADAGAAKPVSFATGAKIRLAADVKKDIRVTANIVGFIEGSDPILKNEVVVIGAHMDHWGMGGPGSLKPGVVAIHPGADDNASGTAGVLQLAAYFGKAEGVQAFRRSGVQDTSNAQSRVQGTEPIQNPKSKIQNPNAQRPTPERLNAHLKRSLVLICFSGEELGLFGSLHYVNHPLVPLEKTVAMLNMDMVGRLRANALIVSGTGTAKEWNSLINEVNQTAGFQVARSEDGFGASDQQSFYEKNVPVLFFFTGTHPDYHTPTDTADKINAEGEARVIQMVADCAAHIADNPERPTFQRIQTPTTGTPRRGSGVYFGSVPDYAAMVEGVQLSDVTPGSPAEKAGLRGGDIVIKFGGKVIKNLRDYFNALQDHKPGDEVEVVIKRGDKTLTLTATLTTRARTE